jgi:hypothetical protein
MERAVHDRPGRERWLGAVRRLHELAAGHRLRELPVPEVERICLGRE